MTIAVDLDVKQQNKQNKVNYLIHIVSVCLHQNEKDKAGSVYYRHAVVIMLVYYYTLCCLLMKTGGLKK